MSPPPCAICHEPLDKSTETISCNHSFHIACIDTWAKHSTRPVSCPLCRAPCYLPPINNVVAEIASTVPGAQLVVVDSKHRLVHVTAGTLGTSLHLVQLGKRVAKSLSSPVAVWTSSSSSSSSVVNYAAYTKKYSHIRLGRYTNGKSSSRTLLLPTTHNNNNNNNSRRRRRTVTTTHHQ